jgi:hypothetical protein
MLEAIPSLLTMDSDCQGEGRRRQLTDHIGVAIAAQDFVEAVGNSC